MFKKAKLNKLQSKVGLVVSLSQIIDYHLSLIYAFDEMLSKRDPNITIDDITTLADEIYSRMSGNTVKYNEKKVKETKIFKDGFIQSLISACDERDYFLNTMYKESLTNEDFYKNVNEYLKRIDVFIRKYYYFDDDLSKLLDRYHHSLIMFKENSKKEK